jgi:hypothetical protein
MSTPASTPLRRPLLGTLVLVVSVLSALFALVLLLVPPAVAIEQWSYPLPALPFAVGQVFIGIHHLVLAAGLFAAWRIGLAGSSRLAAVGGVAASVMMALFAVIEFVAGAAGNESATSEFAGALGGLYGVGTILLAIASILFGIAIVRARVWPGVTRLTVLVTGIFLVVPMIPAQLGPFPLRMAALIVWSLLYLGLGIGLRRGAAR